MLCCKEESLCVNRIAMAEAGQLKIHCELHWYQGQHSMCIVDVLEYSLN